MSTIRPFVIPWWSGDKRDHVAKELSVADELSVSQLSRQLSSRTNQKCTTSLVQLELDLKSVDDIIR